MSIRDDVTIDWESSPRVITVADTSDEITIQDLVDTCRYHEQQLINMDYPHLIDAAGKEFLGGTTYVGVTAALQNAVLSFEARPPSTWVLCSILGGNLVAVDNGGSDMDPRLPTAYVSCDRTASASATLQEQGALQYASFGGGVTIDVVNGEAGTLYPIGTIETPVNNILDAVLIAVGRGFHTFFIIGDITLTNTANLENYTIEGESIAKTKITIELAALVFGTEFVNATITGALDGDNTLHHCAVQTLNYVQGHIHDCLLEEYTITLAGTEETVLLNCWSSGASQDEAPIIDMGGAGRGLIVRGHSGGIKLINKTGSESVALDFESGRVIIDSTVEAGNVIIRGIGQVTDNSTGTTVVDTTGVISQTTVAGAVWAAADAVTLLANVQKILGVTYIKEAAVNDLFATTTKFVASFTEPGTYWTRAAVLFLDGQNAGLIRGVKRYNGTTKEVQLQTPLSFAPSDGDKIVVIAARKFLTPDTIELAEAVWAHDYGAFIRHIEGGRWKIDKSSNQMIFYKKDNIIEVARFDLFDSAGQPASDNVFERRRVVVTTTTTTTTTTSTTTTT